MVCGNNNRKKNNLIFLVTWCVLIFSIGFAPGTRANWTILRFFGDELCLTLRFIPSFRLIYRFFPWLELFAPCKLRRSFALSLVRSLSFVCALHIQVNTHAHTNTKFAWIPQQRESFCCERTLALVCARPVSMCWFVRLRVFRVS